jgi:hypothetical protein
VQGAAGLLLEEEIRQAVSGTVGTASGAAAIGLALTIILPSTSEVKPSSLLFLSSSTQLRGGPRWV